MDAPETGPLSSDRVSTETIGNKPRRRANRRVIASAVCIGLAAWMFSAIRTAREDLRSTECEHQLKMLGSGLRNFATTTGGLPPAYLADKNGKPIHSWQSVIKPFIGYYQWRKTYRLTEPWNGPNNGRLLSYPDDALQCPSAENRSLATSDYVAVVGPDTMWPGRDRVTLPPEEGGDQDAVLLIEMPASDYSSLEPRSPTVEEFLEKIKSPTGQGIRCRHRKGLPYVTVGGDVRWFPPATDPETIRRLLKRDPKCRPISPEGMMPLLKHWGKEEGK